MEARLYWVGASVNEYYAFLRDKNVIFSRSLVTSQRQYTICFPFFGFKNRFCQFFFLSEELLLTMFFTLGRCI